MSLFNFNQEEMLSFFAVFVRYSVLLAVLPFVGDRVVPVPVRLLLSLALSVALFPALVSAGAVRPGESFVWAHTAAGIAGTVALEAAFALLMGYAARLAFDAVNFGSNLVGVSMGFATASTYDPHQESQTQIVAEFQMALAMLIFLAIDGHHLVLRAALESFQVVGIGAFSSVMSAGVSQALGERLIAMTGEVIRIGILLAAPVGIALFSVNVVFGVMSKAMPQMNVLVLSLAVSALVGFAVMLISVPEFQGATEAVLERTSEWMFGLMQAVGR